MATSTLVVTHSHRARGRLFQLTGKLECWNSWKRGSGFYYVPDQFLSAALAIPGINRARKPDDLFLAWTLH